MIRKFARRPALAAPAIALLLAACGGGEDAPAADDAEDAGPQGEVLGGTISDAMLPTATVKSQSPQRGGDSGDGEDEGEGDED